MSSIYDQLAPCLGIFNALALLLVFVFLFQGPMRKFWVVLAYVAWELFATAALTIADVLCRGTAYSDTTTRTVAQLWYSRAYWTNDVIVDLFRFVLVIVLIHMSANGRRVLFGRSLATLVLAMMILPFVLFHPTFHPYPRSDWFNHTSQFLNFGASAMNLILWAQLIASRHRDAQVLMVSLGLGVVVAGTSMVYGFRYLLRGATPMAMTGLSLNLVQLIGWTIWCRTFWRIMKTPVGTD